jgi:hypothetical protein
MRGRLHVTPVGGMLQGLPAAIAVADGKNGDLPASRLRRVTAYIDENLQQDLRLAELSARVHMSPLPFRATLQAQHRGVPASIRGPAPDRRGANALGDSDDADRPNADGRSDSGRRATSRRRFGVSLP